MSTVYNDNENIPQAQDVHRNTDNDEEPPIEHTESQFGFDSIYDASLTAQVRQPEKLDLSLRDPSDGGKMLEEVQGQLSTCLECKEEALKV